MIAPKADVHTDGGTVLAAQIYRNTGEDCAGFALPVTVIRVPDGASGDMDLADFAAF